MDNTLLARPATQADHSELSIFLNSDIKIHRHLDWRAMLDWLSCEPFWLLMDSEKIQAVLSCPPDPVNIYWIRLFAISISFSNKRAWEILFRHVLQNHSFPAQSRIVALVYQAWMQEVLISQNWKTYQNVILLKWNRKIPSKPTLNEKCFIRPMMFSDLEIVAEIDAQSFEPVWQHSLETIRHAYEQAAYATVLEVNSEVIAYQISTAEHVRAHLARLAVLPAYRRQQYGYALVVDMLYHFRRPWIKEITVNTQEDNLKSIHLYQKTGFALTGETYPILEYPLT